MRCPEPLRGAPPAPAPAAPAPAPATPDAKIEITNRQLGTIGQVAWGSGTLIYRGRRLPFRLRALGADGVLIEMRERGGSGPRGRCATTPACARIWPGMAPGWRAEQCRTP